MLLLLTTLFLFPLLSHFLDALLRSNSRAVFWFPPFWFLGLYEHLLRGESAAPVFLHLAHIAERATTVAVIMALVTTTLARKTTKGLLI